MLKETKDTYEVMLEIEVSWFEVVTDWCDILKDGKVSQHEAITNIKGTAIRAAEYIKKRMKGGEQ